MPILSDPRLLQLMRLRLPVVQRLLARRAAARALHAPALAIAPDDPTVLALLGLFADVPRSGNRGSRRARALAAAALGQESFLPSGAAAWPRRWRRRLAAALAPRDPAIAGTLLRNDPLAAAACLLGADLLSDAATLAAKGSDGGERALIEAAVASRLGDAASAAGAINRCFDLAGLSPPLGGSSLVLDAYDGSPALPAATGPLVSMVVPMHDNAATIAAALRSLQRQSWRALEIIVADDRSSDEGPAIVAALAAADPRIRFLPSDQAPGASGTRNAAIAVARGSFIAFLDADDWAHPERVARQMTRLGSGAATVSAHYRVDGRGSPTAPRVFPLLRLCPISMLVRRAVLDQVGGFDLSRAGADAELLGRLDTHYGRAAIPRDRAPLTVARWRAHSISSDARRGLLDRERLVYRSHWMRAHASAWAGGDLPRPVPAS